ncbi:MAG TPA: hypothetical protein VKU19_38190 [Bryobacteraceae bacterium]|nr:hypothetical protein [Bryobacteraceae bacterium]
MPALALSPIGLLLASVMSVVNVLTDVARKRALNKRDLIPATFWMRVAVALVFGGTGGADRARGHRDHPRWRAALRHRRRSPGADPHVSRLLALDVGLITCVMWLYFRALQVSPLSLCVPFLSFTPVFLIPSGFVVLGELPPAVKLLGVLLIVVARW